MKKVGKIVFYLLFGLLVIYCFIEIKGLASFFHILFGFGRLSLSFLGILVIAMSLSSVYLTFKHRRFLLLFIKYNRAYVILLLYCIVSSFWSQTTGHSFFQAFTLLLVVYSCWIYFCLTKDLSKSINSIALFLNTALLLSLLLYFLTPEYAIHQFGVLDGAFKGIMKHKNLMGQVALFAFFFNLERVKNSRKRIATLIMLVLAVVVLFMTKSFGTTIVFFIGIMLYAILSRVQIKRLKFFKTQNLIIFIIPFLLFSLIDHSNPAKTNVSPSVSVENGINDNVELHAGAEDADMIKKEYHIAFTTFPWLDSSYMKELIFPRDNILAYIVISKGYTRRGIHGNALAW
jgi:hypothetical protein